MYIVQRLGPIDRASETPGSGKNDVQQTQERNCILLHVIVCNCMLLHVIAQYSIVQHRSELVACIDTLIAILSDRLGQLKIDEKEIEKDILVFVICNLSSLFG